MKEINTGKNFLLNGGHELIIEDKEMFDLIISGLNFEVPKRTEGRQQVHRERYTMINYLKVLNSNNKLDFPLKIIRSDRPDFIIEASIKIGIEVTEATDQDFQKASTQLEKEPEGTFLEIPHYTPQNRGKPSFRGIKRNGNSLDSNGWVGEEVEIIWNEYILEAILKKLKALNNQEAPFKEAQKYNLLIQDETPTIALDLKKALEMAQCYILDRIICKNYNKFYEEISIVRYPKLIYDLSGQKTILEMV